MSLMPLRWTRLRNKITYFPWPQTRKNSVHLVLHPHGISPTFLTGSIYQVTTDKCPQHITDLLTTDAGDILIGDSHGNKFHVVVFANDGSLLGEFECPHVKVGRVAIECESESL